VLDKAILAARSCNHFTDGNKEEIPYEEGDIMTIMLALMHAETTVLRWDKNGNNFMDSDEVNKAYEIYSPALDGFLEGKNPIIKKFKKQIYQYMIKYEKIPDEKDFGSLWNFVKFLLSFNKKANASRKTIISVLVVIGEQNRLLQTSPQFNCNLLRDPLNIPRTVEESFKGWMKQKSALSSPTLHELTRTKKYLDSLGPEMIEGLKDDLYLFADDFRWERVKSVQEIRQPQLKEVLIKIFADKLQMAEIRSLIPEGSDLHKVAFAVSSLVVD
jgi:hypothetical protein